MPDEPTYREDQDGDRTTYTCLIPDAGREDGICGHRVSDEGFMTQHMQQRHAGVMVKAPPAEESGDADVEGTELLSPPADTAPTSPEPVPPPPATTAPANSSAETPEEGA
jgi:hypothetical protein